jgi:alpha-galactosidase
LIHAVIKKLIVKHKKNFKVEATLTRKKALAGADAVITAIHVGEFEALEDDYNIPNKYGMKQTVADTTGPGGIFRFVRIVPVLIDICKDMERLCPEAILLNYSNPMCMNMTAIQQSTSVRTLGLCHSIQELTHQTSKALGIPQDELDIRSAGVNHCAWFYHFQHKGKELYPELRKILRKNPDAMGETQRTRVDLFMNFGMFPTEGPFHHAEYHPYYLPHQSEIDRCLLEQRIDSYLKNWGNKRNHHQTLMKKMLKDPKELTLEYSAEYACAIISSYVSNENPTRIHASVMNEGLITNLPRSVSVEVPIFIDNTGINPTIVGDLPPGPVGRTRALASVYDAAAKGYLAGDRELIYQAMLLDPNTSATLTTARIRSMTRDMFRANEDRLREFGSTLARKKSAPKRKTKRK